MNRLERGKMVIAMETIARALNDEDEFEYWLATGVADGDIDENTSPMDESLDCYCDDESFRELMFTFAKLMKSATADGASGTFYFDKIVGRKKPPVKNKYIVYNTISEISSPELFDTEEEAKAYLEDNRDTFGYDNVEIKLIQC